MDFLDGDKSIGGDLSANQNQRQQQPTATAAAEATVNTTIATETAILARKKNYATNQ